MKSTHITCDICPEDRRNTLIIPNADHPWIQGRRAEESGWDCSDQGDYCPTCCLGGAR